jgi:rod shape-determining protein MreD
MALSLNLEHRGIGIVFLIALASMLTVPIFFPSIHLIYFAPVCILFIYQKPLVISLWGAFLSGTLVDVLSDNNHLGIHAAVYCIATIILYPQRRHFFADSWATLSLMSALFSAIASFTEALGTYIFENMSFFSWQWVGIDLIYLSGYDALYAYLLFVFPVQCFQVRLFKRESYL